MSEVQLCQLFRSRADDLVGHDLSPEETARWTAHARQCSRCGAQWRQALTRAAALSTLTPWALEAAGVKPPVPGSTADAVFARLAGGEGIPTLRQRWWRPMAAAAAILVMAGGAALTAGVWLDARKNANRANAVNTEMVAGLGADEGSGALSESDAGLLPLGEDERRVLLQSVLREEALRRRFAPQFFTNQNVPVPAGGIVNVGLDNHGSGGPSGSVGDAKAKPQRF